MLRIPISLIRPQQLRSLRGDHDLFAAASLEGRQRNKVGVVGLGGLGHMAVKFANAFGAHVVLFTTSPGKTQDALKLWRA